MSGSSIFTLLSLSFHSHRHLATPRYFHHYTSPSHFPAPPVTPLASFTAPDVWISSFPYLVPPSRPVTNDHSSLPGYPPALTSRLITMNGFSATHVFILILLEVFVSTFVPASAVILPRDNNATIAEKLPLSGVDEAEYSGQGLPHTVMVGIIVALGMSSPVSWSSCTDFELCSNLYRLHCSASCL